MDSERIAEQLAGTIICDLKRLLSGQSDESVDGAIGTVLRENADRIGCFSDLHEYLDGNTLGDSEKVWEELTSDIPPDGDEQKIQAACDVVNEAQTIVDSWIKRGGLSGATASFAPEEDEK